jgi:hypothetical protein
MLITAYACDVAAEFARASCTQASSEFTITIKNFYYYYYKIYIAHKSMEVHFQMRITRIKRTTLYTYSKNTNL